MRGSNWLSGSHVTSRLAYMQHSCRQFTVSAKWGPLNKLCHGLSWGFPASISATKYKIAIRIFIEVDCVGFGFTSLGSVR